MAAPHTQTFPVQLRQPGTVQNTFTVPARPPGNITVKMNSPDWLTTPGLTLAYRARKSSDGGVTWVEAGGLTATSPTYMKDRVTQVEPGLIEEWSGVENRYQVQVTTTQAFNWGMTFSIADV